MEGWILSTEQYEALCAYLNGDPGGFQNREGYWILPSGTYDDFLEGLDAIFGWVSLSHQFPNEG